MITGRKLMEEINMMNNKTKRSFCLIFSVLMMLMLLPLQVFAAGTIDLEKDVSLTISYKDDSTAISGARFQLYRVADVDAYAYSEFTLTEEFEASGVSVNDLDSSGWRNAASTLSSYAQRNSLTPIDRGYTDSNGLLTFPTSDDVTLKPGLYLVIGRSCTVGNVTYRAEPFLVSLPSLNEVENSWDYDGVASPKFSTIVNNKKIDRKVLKVWDDEGYEFKRPDKITAVLLRDGVVYDSVELSEENSWSYRWYDLDSDHIWSVTEETVPAGYTVSIKQEGITFVITNTYNPDIETVDKEVIKVWDDGENAENRPSGVTVELICGNQVYDTVTLNELNNWRYTWHGLDASARWSVNEKIVPDGYTASVTEVGNTFIITNTADDNPDGEVSKKVIKIWEDDGYEENRPSEIKVELLADGVVFDTVILNPENNWSYQWTGLDENVNWSVREVELPENYTSKITVDGNTIIITNTYEPPYTPSEPEDITVIKIWKDKGHETERPSEVQVALIRNGEIYEIVTLNEENEWTYHWYSLDGDAEWTVEEYTMLNKYTSKVTKDGNTFIVTNSYSVIPQTGQLWWPVPMLLALGFVMIIVGMIRRRGSHEE